MLLFMCSLVSSQEIRNLDRDIGNLKRAEDKAKKECQKLAKTGNIKSAKILAKEIVRYDLLILPFIFVAVVPYCLLANYLYVSFVLQVNTRKSMERMHAGKAQLNSVQMQLATTMCKCVFSYFAV